MGSSIEQQVARWGKRGATANYDFSLQAVDYTHALIAQEGIACDVEDNGQIEAALTVAGARRLQRRAELYAELGFDVPYLGRKAMSAVINSNAYCAGLRYTSAFQLNPALLCQGLCERVFALGVALYEESAVCNFDLGRTVRLSVCGHQVEADRVVFATDGYSYQLGLFRNRVIPIRAYACATRPLTGEEKADLGWPGREGIYDARRLFNFFRITQDDRIVFGGGCYRAVASNYLGREHAEGLAGPAQRLASDMHALLPATQGIAITHRWSGILGCTLDDLPLISWLGNSRAALYVGAWNGHGLALATAVGPLIAEMLYSPREMVMVPALQRKTPPAVPGGQYYPRFITIYLAYLSLIDWFERLRELLRPRSSFTERRGPCRSGSRASA